MKKTGLKLNKPLKSAKVSKKSAETIRSSVTKKGDKKLSKAALVQRAAYLENFPELFLGIKPYDWQIRVLRDLNFKESKVAMKAANGSGKTAVVAAAAILWHMMRFPQSLTITTAGVWRQVEDQLWPALRKYVAMLGDGWRITSNELEHTNGSRAIGFSTNDAGKFEGWHRQGPTDNLLMVVDEAKTVPDTIYEAIARCQPSRLLVMSSPGGPQGAFYKAFTKEASYWDTHSVTAFDCPHIPKDWIEEQTEKWGIEHPLVRSMIYGEFMDLGSENLVVPYNTLQYCYSNPPNKQSGNKVAFCDFAAGGDENVLCVREGNEVLPMKCWKERNTMETVGRFIMEYRKYGLEADQIYADAGGLGIPMCDALMESGWTVHRVNNGARANDTRHYGNRGAEMWYESARMIEKAEIRLPEDDLLVEQLTTRLGKTNSSGKLMLERKEDMRKRGISSPDRADALVGCLACGGINNLAVRRGRKSLFDLIWPENEDAYTSEYGVGGMEAG